MDQTENQSYYETRCASLKKLESEGLITHPHKFDVTLSFQEFRARYQHLKNGEQDEDSVGLAGRITSKRSSSSKLFFYDFFNDGEALQIIANHKVYREQDKFGEINDTILKRGDIVGVFGIPARSKTGELSVIAFKLTLLSPCYHNLPHPNTLTDMETRYRAKYLDLITNTNVANTFKMRAKIIKFIRNFFDSRGYVEVETPIMNILPGGATAKPFITHHNDLHANMFLRIAPELYLKQLVIGGLNRVYEIGKNFRNEGIDLTHNPEYTAIETYAAYSDYEDTMRTTEELLSSMVKELTGSYVIPCTMKNGDKCEIDFTPPFRRFPMIETLEEKLNVKFPTDLASQETNTFLRDLLKKQGLVCGEPLTTPRLLDKLVGEYIECDLINPGFITDHPQIMSPLAKGHRSKPGVTERFELFVCKFEICNSYGELDDPFIQRERFLSEAKGRDDGDDEAQPIDEAFCVALEYALPPTAGWGMGIDRLVMLLTNQSSIKEVILFPTMKPLDREKEAQKQMSGALIEFQKAVLGGAK
jgi:lysyl-tRNA synthetase class 2